MSKNQKRRAHPRNLARFHRARERGFDEPCAAMAEEIRKMIEAAKTRELEVRQYNAAPPPLPIEVEERPGRFAKRTGPNDSLGT